VTGGAGGSLRNNCLPQVLADECAQANATMENDACSTALGSGEEAKKCARYAAILTDDARVDYVGCVASKTADAATCFIKLIER